MGKVEGLGVWAREQNFSGSAQQSMHSQSQETVLSTQRAMMTVRRTWSGSLSNCRSAAWNARTKTHQPKVQSANSMKRILLAVFGLEGHR